MVEKWVEREVSRGLQGLVALRLPGGPAEDSVTLTLDIWLAAIEDLASSWSEDADEQRIRRAFRTLYRICDRWPPPKLFLDNLGNRDPPRALPAPDLTKEERQRNSARIREAVALLARSKSAEQNELQRQQNIAKVRVFHERLASSNSTQSESKEH
ncbi:hypothetical protein PCO31110_01961 [Pandoraea communis]|uniref:Uncharacterized protein n=1 Tax=Pandoraea communis TaxID=2508297 RepID=A0A5E4UBN2_9BURK|nr:hypothetical protein [Pandoraea communis]VVD97440.1 hypothetical protein PCO31110_01961 [Pandoraea communis]